MRGKTDQVKDPFGRGALVALGLGLGAAIIAQRARAASSSLARRRQLPTPKPPLPGGAAQSLQNYLRSALTLRDIHSLKLTRTRRWAENLRFGLIALSVSATCLSFIGPTTIASDLGVDVGPVEFVIDVILLLLLLVIVAELAWRRGDRANEHQRAIVVLTSFIRDLEDRLRQPVDPTDTELTQRFAERYALIIEILPAHTDADYLDAKRAAAKKASTKIEITRLAPHQARKPEATEEQSTA
jgi:hypothetical protein